jgi:hypothetical protein
MQRPLHFPIPEWGRLLRMQFWNYIESDYETRFEEKQTRQHYEANRSLCLLMDRHMRSMPSCRHLRHSIQD